MPLSHNKPLDGLAWVTLKLEAEQWPQIGCAGQLSLVHEGDSERVLDSLEQSRMCPHPRLHDVTLVRGWSDLQIRRWVILVVPNENRDSSRLVGRTVEHPLDVGSRPSVNHAVGAVMPVVAKRGRDERVGGQVIDVEFSVGPDFGVAKVIVTVGARGIRIRSEIVKRRDVLCRIAAGRTSGACAFDLASGRSACHAHLAKDIVIR